MNRRAIALAGLLVTGASLITVARLQLPQAPPMYEGAFTPPPYRYCSPPPNLASTNTQPSGGQADLAPVNGLSKLGTAEAADAGGSQLVVFFAQGVFKTDAVVHIKIQPRCADAPGPPPHSALVGNDYLIQAYAGSSPDPARPLTLQSPAQILLRVPPIAYNTVRVFYDGSWHDTQFGAQTDLVNVSLDHLGDVAAFNDTSLKTQAKPPPGFNFGAIFVAVLTVIAVLIIAAGIIVQRRRTAAAKKPGPARKR